VETDATDVVGETAEGFVAALLGVAPSHADAAKRPLADAAHARALEHFEHCTALLRAHVCAVELGQRCNVLEVRPLRSRVPPAPCGGVSPRGQCRKVTVDATHFTLLTDDSQLDEIVAVLREFILDRDDSESELPPGGWLGGAPRIDDQYFAPMRGVQRRTSSSSSLNKLARGRSISAPPTPASPLRVRVRTINGIPRIVRQMSTLLWFDENDHL
jgi:hypothetical protein